MQPIRGKKKFISNRSIRVNKKLQTIRRGSLSLRAPIRLRASLKASELKIRKDNTSLQHLPESRADEEFLNSFIGEASSDDDGTESSSQQEADSFDNENREGEN